MTIASRSEAQGQKLHEVSDSNGDAVDARMQAELEAMKAEIAYRVAHAQLAALVCGS